MGMLLCNTPRVPSNSILRSKTLPHSGSFPVLHFKYLTHPLVHRNTILLSKVAKASAVSPSVQCLSTGVMVLMGLGEGCLWQPESLLAGSSAFQPRTFFLSPFFSCSGKCNSQNRSWIFSLFCQYYPLGSRPSLTPLTSVCHKMSWD